MKKPTLLILILTSIAPISVVYAGVLLDAGDMLSAIMYAAAAVVVALACFILLKFASKWQKPQPSELSDISTKDGESLAFLVGYALPLLAVDHVKPTGWFGIATFAVVITSTLFQQQMFQILLQYK